MLQRGKIQSFKEELTEKLQGEVRECDAHQWRGGGGGREEGVLGNIEAENGLISYRPAAVRNSAC